MKTVRIGPHTVLAGLDWLSSQAPTQKEAIEQALEQEPEKKFGIVIEGLDSYAVGLSQKQEKATVGAAWLAESQKNDGDFILIEPLTSGEYWLCAIKNGTPFYGSDIVSNYDKIENEARSLLIAGQFRLITSDKGIEESLGSLASSYTDNDFESTVKGKPVFKTKALKGDKKVLLIVVGAVMLLGVGYLGVDYYNEYANQQQAVANAKAKDAQRKAQEAQMKAAAEAEFNTAKSKMLEDGLKKLNETLSLSGYQKGTMLWAKSLNDLKQNTAGWNYSKVICDTTGCSVLLEPSPGALNKTLFKIFPSASLNEKGSAEIKTTFNWPTNATPVIRKKAEMLVDGVSEFQSLVGDGVPVTWTPLVDLTVDIPIPQILQTTVGTGVTDTGVPLPGAVTKTVESVSLGAAKGSFKIEGHSIWALEGIGKSFKGQEFVFEKMEATFDKEQFGVLKNWTIEGSYYAKP